MQLLGIQTKKVAHFGAVTYIGKEINAHDILINIVQMLIFYLSTHDLSLLLNVTMTVSPDIPGANPKHEGVRT